MSDSDTKRDAGWIQVDDETLLALRLMAEDRQVSVPQLVRVLAFNELRHRGFPLWSDGGPGDE